MADVKSLEALDALAGLEEEGFRAAVVDVELEDVSGLEALRLLRSAQPDLAVIVTAAQNSRELEARVRREDVVYYYLKHFEAAELLEAVERTSEGRTERRSKRILIVDDDPQYQKATRQIPEAHKGHVTGESKPQRHTTPCAYLPKGKEGQ